ncbi:MAG: hypothetical protein EPN91_08475 [Salinibacterium sp.]|nr:MAG: hypothetical protein EPN91_08475 [Salinibacterium sp.]
MSKGLASLKRWKKCQRRVATKALKAVNYHVSRPNASAMKAAANALASAACSKGTKGTKGKKRSSKRTQWPWRKGDSSSASRYERKQRNSKRAKAYDKRFEPPDFARQFAPSPPSAYDDNWGY